jgi:hypothetical protein
MTPKLEIGGDCLIRRPTERFKGKVVSLNQNWVLVIGYSWVEETLVVFNEWFPIQSKLTSVIPL